MDSESEMDPVVGRVKWFDATRGFGFVVSDALDGDILIHFSVLREHGRRSLPEGALIECVPMRLDRGLQAKKVISIDVGASLDVMDRDARKMRGERPFVFTNLKTGQGLDQVVAFIEKQGMLRH